MRPIERLILNFCELRDTSDALDGVLQDVTVKEES